MRLRMIFAFAFVATMAHAQDACRDILGIAFTEVFNHQYSNDLRSTLMDWASSEKSQKFIDSQAGGLSIGYAGLSAGLTESSNNEGNSYVKTSKEFTTKLSDKTVDIMAYSVLSPVTSDAIAAWRECMKGGTASPNGITARVKYYSPSENKFGIELRWQNQFTSQQVPRIKDYYIDNALCSNCKEELQPEWYRFFSGRPVHDIVLRFDRKERNRRVLFSINTDQGPLHPEVVIPIYSPAPKGECSRYCTSCKVRDGSWICDECRLKVSDIITNGTDHISIPEGQSGLDLACYPMLKDKPYTISANGNVWPDYSNQYGNHGGESNAGNIVDWWLIGRLIEHGNTVGAVQEFQLANIRDKTIPITLSTSGSVGKTGNVGVAVQVQHLQLWPNAHGPLGLDKNFEITIRSQ